MKAPDVDFDQVATYIVDAAIAGATSGWTVRSSSAWNEVTYRGRLLRSVPDLNELVPPRSALIRRALGTPLHWLVGPPKVGKTVVAHYLAYLATLHRSDLPLKSRILVHEGPEACIRGMEQLLVGSPTASAAIVLENAVGVEHPLDAEARSAFASLLARVREEVSGIHLLLTSRHAPYLAMEHELEAAGLNDVSGMTITDWYDASDLLDRYRPTVPSLTYPLAEQLGCPALIHQYRDYRLVADPSLRPATEQRYGHASNEITLDKVGLLEADRELTALAMILRLQEYAFALPTLAEISGLLDRPYAAIDHAGLVATQFEFDGETRLRFEHATTREAADLLLADEIACGSPRLSSILSNPRWAWPSHALELWQAEQAAAAGEWERVRQTDPSILRALAARLVSCTLGPPIQPLPSSRNSISIHGTPRMSDTPWRGSGAHTCRSQRGG